MSYTNQTPNYNLPLYVANDKPTYLGDFNSAMNTIDTQMKANADGVATATTLAQTANTNATNAQANAQQALTNAQTAQNTANSANTNAQTAQTAINTLANEFNFTSSNYVVTGANVASNTNILTVAKNASGTLCKIYGFVRSTYKGSNVTTFTTGDTGLRPETDITVNGICLRKTVLSNNQSQDYYQDMTIHTDGRITFSIGSADSVDHLDFFFMASIIFLKDFGDVVIPD